MSSHVYTGPPTRWGLWTGAPCRILRKRAGGLQIATDDGQQWTVAREHVAVAPTPRLSWWRRLLLRLGL